MRGEVGLVRELLWTILTARNRMVIREKLPLVLHYWRVSDQALKELLTYNEKFLREIADLAMAVNPERASKILSRRYPHS